MDKTLYLVLENGKVFKGYSIGAEGEFVGETVFQTAVLGYNELLHDPAYCGQIVVQTFPLIGNYGIISDELDSKEPTIGAYIVKSICTTPSNFRCAGNLEDYLKEKNIIGLAGIDTRELTKLIRDLGTMKGKITNDISDIEQIIKELKNFEISVNLDKVSVKEAKTYKADNEEARVCMLDLGATEAFIDSFTSNGITVTAIPYNTKAEDIINSDANGVIVSQGPGNPNEFEKIISELKKLISNNVPIYACGLGHELCAMALGAEVIKHPFGHRGVNQPVKSAKSGKIYITGQNHGYIVKENTLPSETNISFVNVNDGTIEGFNTAKIISTQFAPNICKGPHNTEFIINDFKSIMKGDK